MPAWRRRTKGEIRWPVTITVAAAIALQVTVPGRLVLVTPTWILPAVQGALLVVLVAANPHRIDRQSKVLRMLSLILGGAAYLRQHLVGGQARRRHHPWRHGQSIPASCSSPAAPSG